MDTVRGTSHTGDCWGVGCQGRDNRGWEDWGGIALGEIPNVDDGMIDAANHHGKCTPM